MARKADSGKWFAILVIVLFLMATFSVFIYTSHSETGSTQKKTINDATSTVPINYTAEVRGKVLEVPFSSSYKLIAYTNEPDIEKLDLSIRDINGVYNVAGRLAINSDTNKITADYIYIADILGTNLDYNFLLNNLQSNTNFLKDNLYLYPYAKVDYNSLVDFENKDLNLKKQYALGGSEIIVLVDSETKVGDEIIFAIPAQFRGDVLAGYSAFELQNLSATPKPINSIYTANFTEDFYSISFDKNIPKEEFAVLDNENLDYNYFFSYGTTAIVVSKENKVSEYLPLLKQIEKDFNCNMDILVYGKIFVDKISYLDKNYDVNMYVGTYLDYNTFLKSKDNLQYNITAYLVREKVVSASAQHLGIEE